MDKLAQGIFDLKFQLFENSSFRGLENVTPNSYTTSFTQIILVLVVLGFFFMLLSGGVMWISSQGDKAGIEAARKRITAALVGLFIVFAIFALLVVINSFFGVNLGNLKTGVQLGQNQKIQGVPTSGLPLATGGVGKVSSTPVPAITKTAVGIDTTGGSCTCLDGKLTSSNCKAGYVPVCATFNTCECGVAIGGGTTRSTPFPTLTPAPPTAVPTAFPTRIIPSSTPFPTAPPPPPPVACGGTCMEQNGVLCQSGLICDHSKTGSLTFGVCVVPQCYQGKCTCFVPTPTPLPTNTPVPTATNTPRPTATSIPTNTPTPLPTNTPTNTPTPSPTSTPTPTPTPTIGLPTSCSDLKSYSVAGVPSTSPLVPVLAPFQQTTITCDWGIRASCYTVGNNWTNCGWGWIGTTVVFSCRAPLVGGLYQNYCQVFTSTCPVALSCPAGTYFVDDGISPL